MCVSKNEESRPLLWMGPLPLLLLQRHRCDTDTQHWTSVRLTEHWLVFSMCVRACVRDRLVDFDRFE